MNMKSGFYLVFCLFAFIALSPAQSSSSQDDQPNIVPRNSPRDAPSKKRTARPPATTQDKPADNQDQPNQSQGQSQNQTQGESSSQPSQPANSGNGESSSRDSQVDFKNQPQPKVTRSEPDAQTFDFDPHKAAKDVEIGRFYFSRKNYRAALDRCREALLYKPNDAEATYGMAQTLERLDLPDQAYQEYGKYLEVLPEGPFAKDSKIAIERIKPLLHASKSEPEKRAADDLATGELLLARNDCDGAGCSDWMKRGSITKNISNFSQTENTLLRRKKPSATSTGYWASKFISSSPYMWSTGTPACVCIFKENPGHADRMSGRLYSL